MEIIHQGKQPRKYFVIVRPIPDPKQIKPGDKVLMRHPDTQEELNVVVSRKHWWNLSWEEVSNSMCMLDFGMTRNEFREHLESNNLEFKNCERVKFMMVMELETQNP